MKRMKNPDETNGYVMLYIMQDERSLDVLKKGERFINKLEYASEHLGDIYGFFREKYTYFVKQIKTIVPKPDGVELPIWCSVSNRDYMRSDENPIAYYLKVPTEKIVYFDGSKWNYVLNNHYVPTNEDGLEQYYEYLKDSRIPNPFIIGSEDYRCLYPEEYRKMYESYKRISDMNTWNVLQVQGNIWRIAEDMIIKVYYHDDPIDISEENLIGHL